MKRWAIAVALLILAAILFAPDARALSILLNEGASLQLAVDNAEYDTIYVNTGIFDEDVVIRRPLALLAAPSQANSVISFPQLRSLTLDATTYPQNWFGGVVRGFRIYGPVKMIVGSATRAMEQAISSCRIDGGFTEIGGTPDLTMLAVNYCTIFGEVDLRHSGIDFTMNTVLNGGVKLASSEGWTTVARGVHVQDAPGVAIQALGSHGPDVIVSHSTVTRAQHGIHIGDGNVVSNVVTDVAGDGFQDRDLGGGPAPSVRNNRFERCGRGIAADDYTIYASGNVVLNSIGDGIVARAGYLDHNTVVRSGGSGIKMIAAAVSVKNVVAFNSGAGVTGGSSSCDLAWQNGIDARDPDNVYADPLFCDLNAGDVHVSVSSPAAGGTCGPIGALGAGCPARGSLAAAPDGDPDVGMAPFGVQQRGRVALVTLAGPDPASLELLDVAGRLLSRTAIASSREVPLEQPAGVYFMRLTQGARSSSAKAVVLR